MNTATNVIFLSSDNEVPHREVPHREVPHREVPHREVPPREISNGSAQREAEHRNGVIAEAPVTETSYPVSSPLALSQSLENLARLVANVTESFTTVIFVADSQRKSLRLTAHHSLTRDIVADCEIDFGSGLVGWTAENGVRISVCPFEHSSTTLLYYQSDQLLKSFIAVPILGQQNEVLGVIACDSKKSYAYAKITEKALTDCAKQAAVLIRLHQQVQHEPLDRGFVQTKIDDVLAEIQSHSSEESLLSSLANLPQELIEHDAFVIVTNPVNGVGKGRFYAVPRHKDLDNKLFQTVCRNRKILCADRSIHALPIDDVKQRSFLSIPFHVMDREAGSFNVLSTPFAAFSANDIEILEQLAKVTGRELERFRLRKAYSIARETSGLVSWDSFRQEASNYLKQAKEDKAPVSLVRLSLSNITDIEDYMGISVAQTVMSKLLRLIEQVKGAPTLASHLYGFQILLLTESKEAERIIMRLERLIANTSFQEFHIAGQNLSGLILRGLKSAVVRYPVDGDSLEELAAKSLRLLNLSLTEHPAEMREYA